MLQLKTILKILSAIKRVHKPINLHMNNSSVTSNVNNEKRIMKVNFIYPPY